MQQSNVQVLDQIGLVNLSIHTWSGRKKLRPEDIKGKVPPKKLASLGSKRIVDPKQVAMFESLKRRAERLLASVGIRMMGTYAVPVGKIKELAQGLKVIKEEFESKKTVFISDYNHLVENWIEEQDEWSGIIRSAITPVSQVEEQLAFGWQIFKVRPCGIDDAGLDEEVTGLSDRLFTDISKESFRCFEESFLMKHVVKQTAVRPVKAIHEKLKGLSFLDQRAGAICDLMEETLSSLPTAGPIEGTALNKLFGLLVVLSSPAKMTDYGQRLIDGEDVTGDHLVALSGLDIADDEQAEDIDTLTDEASFVSLGELTNNVPAQSTIEPPAWF